MKARLIFFWVFSFAIASAHPDTEPEIEPEPCQAENPGGAKLKVKLLDSATGETTPGCIRISANDGAEWLDLSRQLLPRATKLRSEIRALGWHTLIDETELDVPPGPLKIEAFAGLEFDAAAVEVAKDAESVEIGLTRLFDASEAGWVAGNTHLHLRQMTREEADRYLLEIHRGDGLEIVFVSYLERALVDRDYTTNAYTKEDLKRLSTPDLIFGDGEEYRHNFGGGGEGYGHVMLLDLAERILPASVGPGITKGGTDGVPLQPGIEKARGGGATVIWCHNLFGMEDLPNWLKGNVHAQNIFDGGNRGSYADTFYRYLDIGLPAPFSTGTDWFTYDFSRAYVKTDEVSVDGWLAALRESKSIITNGPWIEFEVDGVEPGGVIDLQKEKRVTISARVICRHDFGAVEIIEGGRVVATKPARKREGGGFGATIEIQQLLSGSAWLAARIQPKSDVLNELNQPLFGHTSAVTVTMNGEGVFKPEVAAGMSAEIEESRTRIAEQGQFANDAERDRVLAIYSEALKLLQDR